MANLRIARRSGFIRRDGVMRRETVWGSIVLANTALGAGGDTVLVRSLSAAFLELRPFTMVRNHLFLSLQSDQTIATEDQQAAFGTCVVSDQAQAIGVTAVPTPLTDLSSDLWLLWAFMQHSFMFSANGIASPFNTWKDVDSKAMRKVEDGQDVIDVIELPASSDGVTLTSVGRFLVKLH